MVPLVAMVTRLEENRRYGRSGGGGGKNKSVSWTEDEQELPSRGAKKKKKATWRQGNLIFFINGVFLLMEFTYF